MLRKKIAKLYNKFLNCDSKKLEFLKYSKNCSYFIFQIFVKSRDKMLKELKKNNIGCSIHYLNPIPNFTFYKDKYKLIKKEFENSFAYGKKNISLPNHPKLKLNEIKKICEIINKNL